MLIDEDFKFRLNISRDYYVKKTDASACLSKDGAKSIGKVKMAFREYDVTVDQFLEGAIKGYAFCNLFDFDPDQSYWFETGDGHRYQTTPLYKEGANKGWMRLEFKSDRFFHGAQTVFVDIDKTRFLTIPEYLQCLTYPPTCVYMSYSDRQEKRGVTSRRFRMVYVFDHVLGKDDLNVVSRVITESIVRDTGEPMEDDCGERVSQYFNGVYDNYECYASYCIYSLFDFPSSLSNVTVQAPASPSQQTEQPGVKFDERLLHDMGTMDYRRFMHYYSLKYHYIYRTERAEWIDGLYQETSDDYLQLWWPREKITDGNHRRRTLFKFACLRRLIMPGIDANTLLFNMYLDFHRFIDNSDHIITLDTLTRRTKRAMMMTDDELLKYCQYEIDYWRKNRPKFIMHPAAFKSQALVNGVKKRIHYSELDRCYDTGKSVQENASELGVSQSTLYRYCSDRYIETNPGKGLTYVQKRQAKKQAKIDKKAEFMKLYDPNLSAAKNREIMLQNGLELSESTVRNWAKGYVTEDMIAQPSPKADLDSLLNLGPITISVPKFKGAWWNSRENDPLYAEYEAKWREACRR